MRDSEVEDQLALVEATLESGGTFVSVLHELRNELGTGLRDAAYVAENRLRTLSTNGSALAAAALQHHLVPSNARLSSPF